MFGVQDRDIEKLWITPHEVLRSLDTYFSRIKRPLPVSLSLPLGSIHECLYQHEPLQLISPSLIWLHVITMSLDLKNIEPYNHFPLTDTLYYECNANQYTLDDHHLINYNVYYTIL